MSQIIHGPEAIAAHMRRNLPKDAPVQLPPPAFNTFGAEFTEYAPGGVLKATFLANPSLANPVGVVLGAAVGAAVDILFGSFAYMETGVPCTTVTMETTFVRPIIADGGRYRCEVSLRAKTKRFMFLEGRAFTQDHRLAMTSTTTMLLLN